MLTTLMKTMVKPMALATAAGGLGYNVGLRINMKMRSTKTTRASQWRKNISMAEYNL